MRKITCENRIFEEQEEKPMIAWIREHRYCYAVGYMGFYLAAFFLSERLLEPRYIISCPWDALIPFNEYFIIPYCMWFLLLPASWVFTMVTEKKDFQDLCMIMFGGMTLSILLYWIFPNGLELRPEEVHDNFCGLLVGALHQVDTPGNVCPSIHVSSSTAVAVVALRSDVLRKKPLFKWGTCLVAAAICLSTMFLKQHSVVDVICGCLVTAILAVFTYCAPWRRWMKGTWMEFFL